MADANKVILIGRLTRDPEVRDAGQSKVADCGLATNRRFNTSSGEKREEVCFVDLTAWNRTAELMGEYLKKGAQVYVEGRLQLDTWQDRNTQENRSKLKVVVENLQFLDRKGETVPQGEEQAPAAAPAAAPRDDDAIPF
jgi:single-strand DNA-binding protein